MRESNALTDPSLSVLRNQDRSNGSGPRVRSINTKYTAEFEGLLAQYREKPLEVSFRELVGPLPADELTHGIFPYPARLLRQIPRMLLGVGQIVSDIDYIVDPFCGSGTVLLEAQTRGMPAFGFDQNPVASLISKVKTTAIDQNKVIGEIRESVEEAKKIRSKFPAPNYLEKWYDDASYSVLGRLATQISRLEDSVSGDILKLAVALLSRKVSYADRRITVPVRSQLRMGKIYSFPSLWAEVTLIAESIVEKIAKLPSRFPRSVIQTADMREQSPWQSLPKTSRGLVVTSPPYGAAQKYVRSTSLEAGWLGYSSQKGTIEIERTSIGREHLSSIDRRTRALAEVEDPELQRLLIKIRHRDPVRANIYQTYFNDMSEVFDSMATSGCNLNRIVLISGTNMIGDIHVDTRKYLASMLIGLGYNRRLSLRDPIRGRTLLTARRGKGKPAPAEYIEIFEFET